MKKLIANLLPWLITAAIGLYIGLTSDWDTVAATLKAADFVGFAPVVVLVVVTVFLFDSWCLVKLFTRFNARVTYREMLPLKGTSYFLNVINYNAAAAGIALFFRNRKGVPLLEAMGSMLWMNFIDIVSLATLLLIGLAISPAEVAESLRMTLTIGALSIYLILVGSCIYWNAGFDWFVLGRMRSWRIFHGFRQASPRDYAYFISVRTAFVLTYVVSQWASMPFFNLDASLTELLLYVPALTFIGTIPLTTIAGLGTVQVLMRTFFYDFVPGSLGDTVVHSTIDAYSTTTILTFILCRVLIGALFMSQVSRDFKKRREDDAQAAA